MATNFGILYDKGFSRSESLNDVNIEENYSVEYLRSAHKFSAVLFFITWKMSYNFMKAPLGNHTGMIASFVLGSFTMWAFNKTFTPFNLRKISSCRSC
jgi:hypothetical protein